jgi:SPOR domain
MYALSFSSRAQADEARSRLEAEGYAVDLQEQPEGGLVVVAVPGRDPSPAETLVARMRPLADDLGGEFLGYGGLASYRLG